MNTPHECPHMLKMFDTPTCLIEMKPCLQVESCPGKDLDENFSVNDRVCFNCRYYDENGICSRSALGKGPAESCEGFDRDERLIDAVKAAVGNLRSDR